MILNCVSILNFKNIEEAALQFSPKVNCFIGNNGMGKTNILDAIYYLSFSKSYINQGDSMVIHHDADFLMLKGDYTRRAEPLEIALSLQRGKRKTMKRNGKEYKKLSEHIGLLPAVMVSPMDWELIRGAGDERRRLMDMIISQSNAEYLAALIRYGKAIENRNALIKQGYRDPILFETVEEQMCAAGQYIHECRKAWVEDFSPIFMNYYQAISGSAETVSLEYKSHLNQWHNCLPNVATEIRLSVTLRVAYTATTSSYFLGNILCAKLARKDNAKPTPSHCDWLNTTS